MAPRENLHKMNQIIAFAEEHGGNEAAGGDGAGDADDQAERPFMPGSSSIPIRSLHRKEVFIERNAAHRQSA